MRLPLLLFLSSAFSPLFPAPLQAAPFNFFGGSDIDYWREGKMTQDHLSQTEPFERLGGPNILRSQDTKPFKWSNYQDPLKPEFWDDGGDWIPPRPFREAAASPTPENIKAYLKWQEGKARVVSRFQTALENESAIKSSEDIDWQKVKIIYFYQSLCSHCQASVPFIEELKTLGVKLTFVQLDRGPSLHTPSIPYDATWAKEFPVTGTPTWVIKTGAKVVTHVGELTLNSLKQFIKDKERTL